MESVLKGTYTAYLMIIIIAIAGSLTIPWGKEEIRCGGVHRGDKIVLTNNKGEEE